MLIRISEESHRCGQRDADQADAAVPDDLARRRQPGLEDEIERPREEDQPMQMIDWRRLEGAFLPSAPNRWA